MKNRKRNIIIHFCIFIAVYLGVGFFLKGIITIPLQLLFNGLVAIATIILLVEDFDTDIASFWRRERWKGHVISVVKGLVIGTILCLIWLLLRVKLWGGNLHLLNITELGLGMLIIILVMRIVTSLSEELFFRVYLLKVLQFIKIPQILGIWILSITYGILCTYMHDDNWVGFVYTCALSLLMLYLRRYSKNYGVLGMIATHFAYTVCGFILQIAV